HKTQARVTVADDLGIPVSALNGISGETPEEIKTNAEALLSLGKRSPHIPNIGDASKAKRTTAEIFADHIRSQISGAKMVAVSRETERLMVQAEEAGELIDHFPHC